LEGVASGLVRDTVALRRFAQSSFLWHSAVAPPPPADSHASSISSSASSLLLPPPFGGAVVAWPQSAALLDDALTLALRHLLAAKMVELSFSRDTPRPECDGCWGERPRGRETLTSGSEAGKGGGNASTRRSSGIIGSVSGALGEEAGRLVCGICASAANAPLCALALGRAVFFAGVGPDEGVLLQAEVRRPHASFTQARAAAHESAPPHVRLSSIDVFYSIQVKKAARRLHVGQGSQHLHALYLLAQPFGNKALYPAVRASSGNGKPAADWSQLLCCLPASEAEARAAVATATASTRDVDDVGAANVGSGGSVGAAADPAGAAAAMLFGGAAADPAGAAAALVREERAAARTTDAFTATLFDNFDWSVIGRHRREKNAFFCAHEMLTQISVLCFC
jgi:hypothetical protein